MKYEVHREKVPQFVPVTVTLVLDTPEKLNAFVALAVYSFAAGAAVDARIHDKRETPAPGANCTTIDNLFPGGMVDDLMAEGARWRA